MPAEDFYTRSLMDRYYRHKLEFELVLDFQRNCEDLARWRVKPSLTFAGVDLNTPQATKSNQLIRAEFTQRGIPQTQIDVIEQQILSHSTPHTEDGNERKHRQPDAGQHWSDHTAVGVF